MKSYLRTTVAAAIAIASVGAFAATKTAEVVFQSDNWTVSRTTGLFSSAAECIGTYKDDRGIQLSLDALSVHLNGDLQSITVRFDDKPARPVRYASRMEQNLRAIQISGGDLSELLNSSRLRVQTTTPSGGVLSDDIKVTGIKDAYASIKSGCTAPAAAVAAPAAAPAMAASPKMPAAPTCSDEQITRMEEQGLKTKQIIAICR